MAGCENGENNVVDENDIQVSFILTDSEGSECYEFNEGDTIVFRQIVRNLGEQDIYFDGNASYVIYQAKEFGKIYNAEDGILAASPDIWMIDDGAYSEPQLLSPDDTWELYISYPEYYMPENDSTRVITAGEYFTKLKPLFYYYDTEMPPADGDDIYIKELDTDTITLKFNIL